MNRFRRTKKEKVKEDVVVNESSSPSSFGAILKKGKKEPEKEPKLDLSNALPSTDDFRTSLLMPKLSARFSMLREQDDPESLLGKASDDSVLFPRRASRLNLFGHNPSLLSDIDEVSDGGRGSFNIGRGSYASGSDGYAGDDDAHAGSIMSRGRRTEGNNLFGGRQKVYKIAPSGSGRGGRVVYENDITQSVFQREKAKEGQEKDEQPVFSPHESSDALSSVSSTKRTTYSSTASGPNANVRISTSATSVDEQPLATSPAQGFSASPTEHAGPKSAGPGTATERGPVKTRRLYGQALEQSVHSQQASALHRLESLNRHRAATPELPPLTRAYSRSATNLRDRLQKLAITEPSPAASRPTSPPSSATSPTRPSVESDLKPPAIGQAPLSPPVSENEDGATLMAALQPGDRGKATAMGLFNKPRTAYDESQFSRRQLQLFQGRNTPPLRQRSPPAPAPLKDGRTRGFSNASHRSRAGSAASSYYGEAHRPGSRSTTASVNASPARSGHVGTFYDNSSPSETEDEGYGPSRDTESASPNEHPALRSRTPSKPSTPTSENNNPVPEVRYSDLGDLKPIAEHSEHATEQTPNIPEKPDSPTLPSGLGLSGLVRTHLRRDSDRSSILPPPSPRFPQSTEPGTTQEPPINQPPSAPDTTPPPNLKPPPIPAWQDDIGTRHRREGSTETQKEREEFATELAERRKRVQEKLRDFAESESRAASPVSGRQTPDYGPSRPGNAFSMLKNKPGKHHLFSRSDHRGMKGLNFGGNSSTPSLVSDDPWGEEERMPFPHFGRHGNSSAPHVGERSMRSRIASFGRRSQDDSRESSRSRGASPHSSFRSRRDRSSSDASGRSKSRSRRERDGLGTLEEDDTGSDNSFTYHNEQRGVVSVASSARPSVEAYERSVYDRTPSSASVRHRPESRTATPSLHDRPFHAPLANSPLIGVAPRPSPAAPPFSANATPPLNDLNGAPSAQTPPTTYPQNGQALPQRTPGSNSLPRRAVDKSQISEPTFISCTSNIPTVGLPAGASLSNGMETPPLPPMNPRRRRTTTTQQVLGAIKGTNDSHQATSPDREPAPEHSAFSDEGEKRVPHPRNRLRKISSEGDAKTELENKLAMAPCLDAFVDSLAMAQLDGPADKRKAKKAEKMKRKKAAKAMKNGENDEEDEKERGVQESTNEDSKLTEVLVVYGDGRRQSKPQDEEQGCVEEIEDVEATGDTEKPSSTAPAPAARPGEATGIHTNNHPENHGGNICRVHHRLLCQFHDSCCVHKPVTADCSCPPRYSCCCVHHAGDCCHCRADTRITQDSSGDGKTVSSGTVSAASEPATPKTAAAPVDEDDAVAPATVSTTVSASTPANPSGVKLMVTPASPTPQRCAEPVVMGGAEDAETVAVQASLELSNALLEMMDCGHMSDIRLTLRSINDQFPPIILSAHKCVLARSPLVTSLLRNHYYHHEIVGIACENFSMVKPWEQVVHYIYGRPIITSDRLKPLTLEGLGYDPFPDRESDPEYPFSLNEAMLDMALGYAVCGAFFYFPHVVDRGFKLALDLLSWETVEHILYFGLRTHKFTVILPNPPWVEPRPRPHGPLPAPADASGEGNLEKSETTPSSAKESSGSASAITTSAAAAPAAPAANNKPKPIPYPYPIPHLQADWSRRLVAAALAFIIDHMKLDFELDCTAKSTIVPDRIPEFKHTSPQNSTGAGGKAAQDKKGEKEDRRRSKKISSSPAVANNPLLADVKLGFFPSSSDESEDQNKPNEESEGKTNTTEPENRAIPEPERVITSAILLSLAFPELKLAFQMLSCRGLLTTSLAQSIILEREARRRAALKEYAEPVLANVPNANAGANTAASEDAGGEAGPEVGSTDDVGSSIAAESKSKKKNAKKKAKKEKAKKKSEEEAEEKAKQAAGVSIEVVHLPGEVKELCYREFFSSRMKDTVQANGEAEFEIVLQREWAGFEY
ncbi:uncharacterized protein BJX67DRAFT_376261 [Aspergillus lucknowensis]|uniref:BTB domain-containing protein n=1 Tax=Aspergillus lucknowensis TaxID=176173 RepID=A0ABR4M784_9EURO